MAILDEQFVLFADLSVPTLLATSVISLVYLETRLVPVRFYIEIKTNISCYGEKRLTFHSKDMCSSEDACSSELHEVAWHKQEIPRVGALECKKELSET
jgi:hypothetical protein